MKGTGTTRKRINLSVLKTLLICIPQLPEQNRIVEILNAHECNIEVEERYLSKLKLIKKGLMHDLLTGKVRVRIDDDQGKEYTLRENTEQ